MRASDRLLMIAAGLLVAALPVQAQDKATREREALNRAQKAVAKLQQENSAINREKSELAAKLETTAKDLDGVKGDAVRNRQRATASEKELVALREEREAMKQKLDGSEKQLALLGGQLQEGQQNRQKLEADHNALTARLKQEVQALNSCNAANDKLYVLSRDLMNQYEKAALDKADPVFGLRMVEIETQVQAYRDRADAARLPRPR